MTDRFRDLVIRYQHTVCAVAYATLRDRARSEEVAQEAFLVAWQKLPAMSPQPAMPAWLCGITRNLARNAARRRKESAMPETDPAAPSTPLGDLLDAETEQLANRALAELPETYRDVVVMYYRGDGELSAIASALGISEANAKQRLHRGREKLRAALAAVESTLRATRPSPAFVAGCVAALAAGGASASAHAAAASTSSVPTAVVVAAPIAAILVGGGWLYTRDGHSAPDRAANAIASAAVRSTTSSADVVEARGAMPMRRIDPAMRAQLSERIATARGQREQHVAPTRPASDEAPSLPGEISADDVLGAVSVVVPLLRECYERARPQLHDAGGKLVVHMRFTGEPDIGTLVDVQDIDGDANLKSDAGLIECFRETLMTIELPPLAEGGVLEFATSFGLSREAP